MERYKCRPGVILTEVCGEALLVSARALRGLCPYVTVLNDSSAFLWRRLKSGADARELVDAVRAEFEVEDEDALRGMIDEFLRQMNEQHYLIPDEAGEEP